MDTRGANTKITFANQLRGIAVLCVIVAHYTGIYWGAPDLVSAYIHAPIAVGPAPTWPGYIVFPTLNYGPFGVALFFLISGFVIPFSLQKMGRAKFLVARTLRIFPTYWLASCVTIFVTWVSSRAWEMPFHLGHAQIVTNALLLHGLLNYPTIDLVNWTLAVEFKFYIAAALMWPFIKRSSAIALVNFSVGILAFLTWTPASWGTIASHGLVFSLDALKCDLMYLTFLFIGTLFNFALRKDISTRTLVAAVTGLFIVFLMMWQKTVLAVQFWVVPANYGYALIVFSACYAARARFKASRILDFFADISYPFYLVHALIGYTIIRLLMAHEVGYSISAVCAFISVVALAYVLHILVEVPSANAGKMLAYRLAQQKLPGSIAPPRT